MNKLRLAKKRSLVLAILDKHKVRPSMKLTNELLADLGEKVLGLPKPLPGTSFSSSKGRLTRIIRASQGNAMSLLDNAKPKPAEGVKSFYKSADWKRARYDALKRSDGRCSLCGVSAQDGAKLNVDHIKPLKYHWELRLDPNNLQVLCGSCNQGKGNRDETNWREPRLAVLMGEAIS